MGNEIRASVRFLLVISNAAREFSRECQFKNAMVLESLESNAKLHHLALPTMLSALKHYWGMLALFVVVSRSQPNHTRITVYIQNEVRAAVTDD